MRRKKRRRKRRWKRGREEEEESGQDISRNINQTKWFMAAFFRGRGSAPKEKGREIQRDHFYKIASLGLKGPFSLFFRAEEKDEDELSALSFSFSEPTKFLWRLQKEKKEKDA